MSSMLCSEVIESPLVLVGDMCEESSADTQRRVEWMRQCNLTPRPKPDRSIGAFHFDQSLTVPDPSDRYLHTRGHFCAPDTYACAAALEAVPPFIIAQSGIAVRPCLAALQDTEPQRRAHAIRQSVPCFPAELCRIIASYLLWTHGLPPPLGSLSYEPVRVPLVRAFGVLIEWHEMTSAHYRNSYLTAYITAVEELEEATPALSPASTAPSAGHSVGRVCVSAQVRRNGWRLDLHVPVRAYEHFLPSAAAAAIATEPGPRRATGGWWLRCVPASASCTRRVFERERVPIPTQRSDSLAPLSVRMRVRVCRLQRVYLYSTDHTHIRLTADRKSACHKPAVTSAACPHPPAPVAADQRKPKLLTRSHSTPVLSLAIAMPRPPPAPAPAPTPAPAVARTQ
jgi:hypothetical protein